MAFAVTNRDHNPLGGVESGETHLRASTIVASPRKKSICLLSSACDQTEVSPLDIPFASWLWATKGTPRERGHRNSGSASRAPPVTTWLPKFARDLNEGSLPSPERLAYTHVPGIKSMVNTVSIEPPTTPRTGPRSGCCWDRPESTSGRDLTRRPSDATSKRR